MMSWPQRSQARTPLLDTSDPIRPELHLGTMAQILKLDPGPIFNEGSKAEKDRLRSNPGLDSILDPAAAPSENLGKV